MTLGVNLLSREGNSQTGLDHDGLDFSCRMLGHLHVNCEPSHATSRYSWCDRHAIPRDESLLPDVSRELAIDPAAEVEERPLGRNCRRTLLTQLTDRF